MREDCCIWKVRYIVVRVMLIGEGVLFLLFSFIDVFKFFEVVVVIKNGEVVKDEFDKFME